MERGYPFNQSSVAASNGMKMERELLNLDRSKPLK
jgi:hypothetical protein